MGIKAIIATLPEKINQNEEAEIYKVYVTESARLLGENKAITVGYYDLIHDEKEDEKEPKTVSAESVDNTVNEFLNNICGGGDK